MTAETGLAEINGARLYYEVAGSGPPLVMLHAGIADRRQWDIEFEHFAGEHRVLRYDRRGYGKSEPVEGEYSHMADLLALLDKLGIREPAAVMGCSMGGGLALDFALAHPGRVRAVIMVGAGPSGLVLEIPDDDHPLEALIEPAFEAGDLDKVAEIENEIFFVGRGRTVAEVDPAMRALVFEMDRIALAHEARRLGTRLPDAEVPAAERLGEVQAPVLIVAGLHDEPYILAAADYMVERLPRATKVTFEDAAHMVNMDEPDEFYRTVKGFLDGLEQARAA